MSDVGVFREALTWNDFVTQVEALSQSVFEACFDPEEHAEAVTRLAHQLDRSDPALIAAFDELAADQWQPYVTQRMGWSATCGVVLISLLPDCRVGLHDHPQQSGVILCCGGHVAIEAFDVLPDPPLRLQRCASVSLREGGATHLTPAQGNVHRLFCPEATRLVDVFTPPLTDELRAMGRRFSLGSELEAGVFAATALD